MFTPPSTHIHHDRKESSPSQLDNGCTCTIFPTTVINHHHVADASVIRPFPDGEPKPATATECPDGKRDIWYEQWDHFISRTHFHTSSCTVCIHLHLRTSHTRWRKPTSSASHDATSPPGKPNNLCTYGIPRSAKHGKRIYRSESATTAGYVSIECAGDRFRGFYDCELSIRNAGRFCNSDPTYNCTEAVVGYGAECIRRQALCPGWHL